MVKVVCERVRVRALDYALLQADVPVQYCPEWVKVSVVVAAAFARSVIWMVQSIS